VWIAPSAPDELENLIGHDALFWQRRANRQQAHAVLCSLATLAGWLAAAQERTIGIWGLAALITVANAMLAIRWMRTNRKVGAEASVFLNKRLDTPVRIRGGRPGLGAWRAAIDLATDRQRIRERGQRPPFFAIRVGASARYSKPLPVEEDAPEVDR